MRRSASLLASIAAVALVPVLAGDPIAGKPSEADNAAAFGDPLPDLSSAQRGDFHAGFQLFIKTWTPKEGLGPNLNAKNCVACHAEPMPGGSGTASRTFVLQLPEAGVRPSSAAVFRRFRLDTGGELIPDPVPPSVRLRKTPPLFGMGLLEAVPVEDLLRGAESNKQRTDGVAGHLVKLDRTYGRFGWKGNFATIDEVVSFALNTEMGLTSVSHPDYSQQQPAVEVDARQVRLIAEYIRFLAPPPRKKDGAAVVQGEELFQRAGCHVCHRASWTTSPAAGSPLGNRVIHPYTDFLVHDMGRDMGEAAAERWIRTPPLWGLSSTGPPFLHDGRATTLEEAILLHGGEAAASTNEFRSLTAVQRALMLEFLDSL